VMLRSFISVAAALVLSSVVGCDDKSSGPVVPTGGDGGLGASDGGSGPIGTNPTNPSPDGGESETDGGATSTCDRTPPANLTYENECLTGTSTNTVYAANGARVCNQAFECGFAESVGACLAAAHDAAANHCYAKQNVECIFSAVCDTDRPKAERCDTFQSCGFAFRN
jgi:hypothetical protein